MIDYQNAGYVKLGPVPVSEVADQHPARGCPQCSTRVITSLKDG